MAELTLSGSVKDKSNSVTIQIQTSDPFYVLGINGDALTGGAESYANMPKPETFGITNIHSALTLSGRPRNPQDKRALVALIFITSEAARFEPFARHINTLIDEGDGSKVLDYASARFYMNHWKNMFEWTFGAYALFKPLTEANMHNWNYQHEMIIHKYRTSWDLSFSETQDSLRPKPLNALRK